MLREFGRALEDTAAVFSGEWGRADPVGTQGVRLRATAGEEIPEPWDYLADRADDLLLWQAAGHGRWVVLALPDPATGAPYNCSRWSRTRTRREQWHMRLRQRIAPGV